MSEWIINKGRKRLPYKKGTMIDVRMRRPASMGTWGFNHFAQERIDQDIVEVYDVECGVEIDDFTIEGVTGDVLAYRLHDTGASNGKA